VFLLDLATGRLETLLQPEEASSHGGFAWKPDGSGFYLVTNHGRERAGLAFYDLARRELDWIETPEHEVEGAALDDGGRYLAWVTNEGGYGVLHARDLSDGRDLPVPELPAGLKDVSWAPRAPVLAIEVAGPKVRGDVWTWDPRGKGPPGDVFEHRRARPGVVRGPRAPGLPGPRRRHPPRPALPAAGGGPGGGEAAGAAGRPRRADGAGAAGLRRRSTSTSSPAASRCSTSTSAAPPATARPSPASTTGACGRTRCSTWRTRCDWLARDGRRGRLARGRDGRLLRRLPDVRRPHHLPRAVPRPASRSSGCPTGSPPWRAPRRRSRRRPAGVRRHRRPRGPGVLPGAQPAHPRRPGRRLP
jgi:hypothetical protein